MRNNTRECFCMADVGAGEQGICKHIAASVKPNVGSRVCEDLAIRPGVTMRRIIHTDLTKHKHAAKRAAD